VSNTKLDYLEVGQNCSLGYFQHYIQGFMSSLPLFFQMKRNTTIHDIFCINLPSTYLHSNLPFHIHGNQSYVSLTYSMCEGFYVFPATVSWETTTFTAAPSRYHIDTINKDTLIQYKLRLPDWLTYRGIPYPPNHTKRVKVSKNTATFVIN
jgi:hypothetical protein